MSSTAFNRLRGLFSKSPSPIITTIKANRAAEIRAPISSKDKKTLSLVKKFKETTDNPRFRRYHHYYEATVLRLAREQHFSAIRDILEHQKKYPDIMDQKFAVRLICLYGKAKMADDAQKLFDELPSLNCERTVVSFNALLGACVNSKNFNKVTELFKELPEKLSIEPDIVSYNTVVKALCDVGSVDSASVVMNEMESSNIQPDVVTFNTLLDAFYKNNRIEEAEKLWCLMEKKNVLANVRTYNSRLRGLVADNRVSDAAELIEEMGKKGVKPDNYSFNALMKGFVDVGNLEEAKVWYKKMMRNGCGPDRATFGMLIPFACDKDDFDYAFELCNDAVKAKQSVYNSVVQRVADGLVERSKNNEAQKLMKMAKLK
ncbi:unnamed protein product [Coffea canephora]|uniref:Pentacotripeptide-repeat region of PRORP domain-containing protein n=2 Tax=Coffea TaxID=13442 RepID=A0A068TWJ5_COFCA|nr:pentatricopeptide repeat-containing protein At1g55890, mitochondrial-like [Coffea arabica]CDO99688.1 unnamed protein product [Coffea canephora]